MFAGKDSKGRLSFSYGGGPFLVGPARDDVDAPTFSGPGVVETYHRGVATVIGAWAITGDAFPRAGVVLDGADGVEMFEMDRRAPSVIPSTGFPRDIPVVLAGEVVPDPEKVASFCGSFPHNKVSICPVPSSDLAAFGALVLGLMARGKFSPSRVSFSWPNDAHIDLPSQGFATLRGDAEGKMAMCCGVYRIPVVNQRMVSAGVDPFNGMVILPDGDDHEDAVQLLRSEQFSSLFPREPPSLAFAADWVPVLAGGNVVFAASHHREDVRIFLGMLNSLGISESPRTVPLDVFPVVDGMLIFRYNRVYRVNDRSSRSLWTNSHAFTTGLERQKTNE